MYSDEYGFIYYRMLLCIRVLLTIILDFEQFFVFLHVLLGII